LSSRAQIGSRHLVGALLLALVISTLAPLATPVAGASAGDAEWKVLALINDYRADHGRAPVRMAPGVRKVAGRRSSSMAHLDYFAHVSPSGIDAGDLLRSIGAPHRAWGEIIGWTSRSGLIRGGRLIVRWWTRSPRHRGIILDRTYRRAGVGVVRDGHRVLWTVVFTS
jgi:uncharacterized protein YkwD